MFGGLFPGGPMFGGPFHRAAFHLEPSNDTLKNRMRGTSYSLENSAF